MRKSPCLSSASQKWLLLGDTRTPELVDMLVHTQHLPERQGRGGGGGFLSPASSHLWKRPVLCTPHPSNRPMSFQGTHPHPLTEPSPEHVGCRTDRRISASLRGRLLIKESPRRGEGPICLFPNAAAFQLRHVCWLAGLTAKASWEVGLRDGAGASEWAIFR